VAAQKAKEMCPPIPPTINVPNPGNTGTTEPRPAPHPPAAQIPAAAAVPQACTVECMQTAGTM
jgi:hypothetical protein